MKSNINYKDFYTRKLEGLEIGEWTVVISIFNSELNKHAEKSGKRFAIKRIGGFIKATRVK